MDYTSKTYFNNKYREMIPRMPVGGSYRHDLRKYGHNIICEHMGKNMKVFDYACGLGVIDKQLVEDYNCKVSACDFSGVAIQYCKENVKGDFRETTEFWGEHDYILAIQFLEHISKPVEWLREGFKHSDKIICSLPNDFNHGSEHVRMRWSNWDQFFKLFDEFKLTRLDEGKYPEKLCSAYTHPVFLFEEKNAKANKRRNSNNEKPIRPKYERANKDNVRKPRNRTILPVASATA